MTKQNRNLRITFLAAVCFLLILSVITYSRLSMLIESGTLVNHTSQVSLELERAIGSLKDAEAGHRGYLFTNDSRFLESFRSGMSEYPLHLKRLSDLLKNNPVQNENLRLVQSLSTKRAAYMLEMQELNKRQKPNADEMLRGKLIMDSLRMQVNKMIDVENLLLSERENQLRKQMIFAPASIFLLSILAFTILIISYWQINKSFIRTERLRNEVIAKSVQLEKRKELQRIFTQAPVTMVVYRGNDFIIEVINEMALLMWGRSYNEVINRPFFEVSPELKEVMNPILTNIMNTGEPFSGKEFQAEFIRNGKSYKGYFDFVYQPLKDEQGNVTGIIAIGTETTDSVIARKKIVESENRFRELAQVLDQKVIERTAELTRQKEFSDLIIDTSIDLIGVYDTEMRLLAFNKACEDFFKIKREDVLGKVYTDVFPASKNTQSYFDLARALKGETIHNAMYHSPLTNRYYENFIAPLKDANGKIYAAVAMAHDITDSIKKQEELEKMNKELQAFAYISSHDLQEPLRKIQTFSNRIMEKEHEKLSDNGKDYFKRMQESARRMQILIEDLLAYSRTSTEERKFEHTDLNRIIEEVKEDLKEELLAKEAILESANMCNANIIPFQFRQLMNNLIGNSLKFSKENHRPHIIIKSEIVAGNKLNNVKLSPLGIYCHITVSDNGIGFEQQYSEKIFEVFQRLHGRYEYNGTGIGLSIVKKIVENHNGLITATGEPDIGASFDIYVPS